MKGPSNASVSQPDRVALLMHIAAAINNQGLSGDKVTFIAGKKDDRANQILT
jgi:hypothetical protein